MTSRTYIDLERLYESRCGPNADYRRAVWAFLSLTSSRASSTRTQPCSTLAAGMAIHQCSPGANPPRHGHESRSQGQTRRRRSVLPQDCSEPWNGIGRIPLMLSSPATLSSTCRIRLPVSEPASRPAGASNLAAGSSRWRQHARMSRWALRGFLGSSDAVHREFPCRSFAGDRLLPGCLRRSVPAVYNVVRATVPFRSHKTLPGPAFSMAAVRPPVSDRSPQVKLHIVQ